MHNIYTLAVRQQLGLSRRALGRRSSCSSYTGIGRLTGMTMIPEGLPIYHPGVAMLLVALRRIANRGNLQDV